MTDEATPETATPADVLALKERMRDAVIRACHEDALCDTAVARVWKSGTDIGRFMKEIERPRQEEFVNLSYTFSVNGVEKTNSLSYVNGYTEDGAVFAYLRSHGFVAAPTLDDEPMVDASNDSDEVKAGKKIIRDFIEQQKNQVEINVSVANKYLRFLGIEELPIRKRFYFELQVEAPKVATVTYFGDGHTEEEAREAALVSIQRDEVAVASGNRRGNYSAIQNENARTWVQVEGTEVTLSSKKPDVLR